MSFSTIGLSPAIMQGIDFSSPTEIQAKVIPLALSGKDIIGCAPTGTGKTAAFVLPMLHRLDCCRRPKRSSMPPRALILTPTRELAQQIEDAIRLFGKYTKFRTLSIYGGKSIATQLRNLKAGVDIVVATPGRLLDHMDRGSIDLSQIEILVLDEADRMFDMGFINAVREIIEIIPQERQTLLFSATMSRQVRSLIVAIQKRDVQSIEIGKPFCPVQSVDQHFLTVPQQSKMELLLHILGTEPIETMLVFSKTKHGADRIAKKLNQNGIDCEAIHSDRTQMQRQKALDGFKRHQFRVLIATDVAARGIDIDKISHVVNFDVPLFAEDYIHRIGRTGRMEARGTALTFVSTDEVKYIRKIESLTAQRCSLKGYPTFSTPFDTEPDMVSKEKKQLRFNGFKARGHKRLARPRFA